MRNLTLFEKADLEKVDDQLSYFLFSSSGWLKGISSYSGSVDLKQEIQITDKILSATDEDLKLLNAHIAGQIEYNKKNLKEANQKVINWIEQLDKFNQLQVQISKQETFQDAIQVLIKNKQ